jgi:hypothetical protein
LFCKQLIEYLSTNINLTTMKKIYFSFLFASGLLAAQAQQISEIQSLKKVNSFNEAPKHVNQSPVSNKTPMWEENFANGLNSTNGTWTTSGPDAAIWRRVTAVANGCYSTGANAGVTFTTKANGFMIFHADSSNCPGGNWTASQRTGSLISPSIDFTGEPSVMVNFQQAFRHCCSGSFELHLSVSNNGGTSWTDYNVTENVAVNASSGTLTTSVNISAVAANQPNVLLRFTFNATSANTSAYFWAIDDISITEAPTNDLRLFTKYWGVEGAWGDRMPYYQVPTTQIAPINFSVVAENIGAAAQPNTRLTVTSGGYTGTSPMGVTFVSGQLDSLHASPAFTPAAAPATHNISYLVSSDSVDFTPANNASTDEVIVNNFIYARDAGQNTGGLFNSGDPYEVGNVFDIFTNQAVYGVSFRVRSSSAGSPVVYGALYSIDQSGFIQERITQDYFVTSAQISSNAVITLPFLTPYTLQAGNTYLVVVGTYGQPGTNDFVTITSGESAPQTSFYLDGTDATWYFVTSTPAVRMNFDQSLNLIESANNVASLGQNYPNPFDATTRIDYTLNEATQVSFEVVDITGKVVLTRNEGFKSAGEYSITLDANQFSSGMYFYTLQAGDFKTTKKMTVK